MHHGIWRADVRLRVALLVGVIGWILAQAPSAYAAEATELPPGDTPPPTVFSRVENAGTADEHDGAAHVIVYDYAMNRMKSSGVTHVDTYTITKVLTAAGCRNESVLRWGYDPQSSHVEIREVNVIRDSVRIAVDVTKVRDLPAPQSWIYWRDRIKTLQLPRLQVNDGIEVRTFRKGFTYALLTGEGSAEAGGAGSFDETDDDARFIPPMPGEYFDIVLFAASVPIVEKKYVLTIPADKRLHSEIYNGPLYASTSYSPDSTLYAWWGLDLPARPREGRQPDPPDYVTKVVMSTAESWEAKSRWFFDINRDQFEVTSAISAKVEEILDEAGLSNASEEAKAELLVHWVAQNIRYSGQTMGKGEGYMLHPAPMIFEQRSGVCKDIAGMLVAMMRAAGMDSYAAMTNAGSRIDDLPADQFNHCVCALRKADGSFEMYDPTWVPYDNSIWSLLEAEQHYVIGSPEGETLARIPYSPPEESPLHISHDATLDDDGTLEGTFKLEASGAMDGRLRGLLLYARRADRTELFARLLSSISDRVEDVRVDTIEPDDFSEDIWVRIDYRIPRFAFPIGDAYEFTSPMMQVTQGSGTLFRAGRTRWEDERKTDILLYNTQLLLGTETIRLPKGYAVNDPPSSDEVDETYAYFKGTSEMDDGDLIINQHAEARRRQIPPDGFEGFKKAMDAATEWGEQVFRIETGGDE